MRDWRTFFWIFLVSLLVHGSGLWGEFHFDDTHSVDGNVAIRSLTNIPSFWTDPKTSSFIPENRVYRPMVYTFYAFAWALGKGSPFPFHFFKIAMHAGVAFLLFLVWRWLWSQPGWFPQGRQQGAMSIKLPWVSAPLELNASNSALLLAVIFALHPATTECVQYVSATTSLLCALFYCWAYWGYLRFRDTGSRRWLLASLALFAASVASKEEGITLPAVIVLTEWLLAKNGLKRGLRVSAPYWALAVGLAFWILLLRPDEGRVSRGFVEPIHYFITQWRMWLWYLRLWFWPWDFNADDASSVFSTALSDPLVIQAAIGNLLLVGFAWSQRKRFPAFLFGVLWYYITISPASSIVVLAEASNEHRMYLSYVGFVGGAAVLMRALAEACFSEPERARILGMTFVLIIAGLVVGSRERARVWATDEALWKDTLEKNPTSGRAMNNLALIYMARAEYPQAIELLKKCQVHWPTYAHCPLNLGVSQMALAKFEESSKRLDKARGLEAEALASLRRAHELSPQNVHTEFHLGTYEQEFRKDFRKAEEHFAKASELTGYRYPAADLRRADCFEQLGDLNQALAAVDRALAAEPESQLAWFQRGKLLLGAKRNLDAVKAYDSLLRINPAHLQGAYNRGVGLLALGEMGAAREAFQRVVELDPKSDQGWLNLAYVLERLNEGPLAIQAAKTLVSQYPEREDFKKRLGELERRFKGARGS